MRKTGFTMIEVMIIIVIIGILATMGLSSYTKSLSRGRDTARISDLKEIQKGFEMYYSAIGSYGACTAAGMGTSAYFPAGFNTKDSQGNTYVMIGCNAAGTTCSPSDVCGTSGHYCVCANLENKDKTVNADASCNFGAATKTHYCVRNVQ